MNIEIHQPEIEALIEQRMASGAFDNVEAVLLHALKSAPLPEAPRKLSLKRTGADIVAVMQKMPYKETDIEPSRPYLSVRDVTL